MALPRRPVFLEEEREKELEAIFDKNLDNPTGDASKTGTMAVAAVAAAAGGVAIDSATAGKRSKETVKAGERLIEALELGDADLEALQRYDADLRDAEESLTDAEQVPCAAQQLRCVAYVAALMCAAHRLHRALPGAPADR